MANQRRLEDKTAIITGAASGIGRATALMFAREGAKLVLTDLNGEGLGEAVNSIAKDGGTAVVKATDVGNEDEVKELVAFALETYSQVDILCNNAGITGAMPGVEDEDAGDWRRVPMSI